MQSSYAIHGLTPLHTVRVKSYLVSRNFHRNNSRSKTLEYELTLASRVAINSLSVMNNHNKYYVFTDDNHVCHWYAENAFR